MEDLLESNAFRISCVGIGNVKELLSAKPGIILGELMKLFLSRLVSK